MESWKWSQYPSNISTGQMVWLSVHLLSLVVPHAPLLKEEWRGLSCNWGLCVKIFLSFPSSGGTWPNQSAVCQKQWDLQLSSSASQNRLVGLQETFCPLHQLLCWLCRAQVFIVNKMYWGITSCTGAFAVSKLRNHSEMNILLRL